MSDEYRHAASGHERWWFDASGEGWAIFCALALTAQFATWWTVIARTGEPLLLVRDDALALPRAGSFEVRGSGLWADVHCHEAMQRWQVNFEGIALGLDDPADVGHRELGDPVPIEFEFEWEATAAATQTTNGYVQNCMVDGELHFASGDAIVLTEPVSGRRGHVW